KMRIAHARAFRGRRPLAHRVRSTTTRGSTARRPLLPDLDHQDDDHQDDDSELDDDERRQPRVIDPDDDYRKHENDELQDDLEHGFPPMPRPASAQPDVALHHR